MSKDNEIVVESSASEDNRDQANADPSVDITDRDRMAIGRNIQIGGDVTSSVLVSGDKNQITINVSPVDGASREPFGEATRNLFTSQVESLSLDLSDEKATRLEELRELFREGATKESYEAVQALRGSPNWVTFSARLRASILRAMASMSLSLKGASAVADAQALAEEASQIEPNKDDVTLRARIKVFAEGLESALADLNNPVTLDGFNLRIALLLDLGHTEDAMRALLSPPTAITFDAETRRLFALAMLASRDVQAAKVHISLALAERPRRQGAQYWAAVIGYFSALSPLAVPPYLVPFPKPVQLSMVKQDDESRKQLVASGETFRQLAEHAVPGSDERKNIEAWHLACIANLHDRQEDAVMLCKKRSVEDPANTRILSWVLFRNYEIDLSASLPALEQSVEANHVGRGVAMLEEVLAMIGLHLKQGTHQEALDLLERNRVTFVSAHELDLWRYWHGQMLIAGAHSETALEESSQLEDRSLRRLVRTAALCEIANRSGDWERLVSHLEKSYEVDGDINSLLTVCELKAQLGEWAYVSDRAELYCDAVGTASAARLVFVATWNTKRPLKCLQLLNKYESLFTLGKLPADLMKLRVHCLISASDVSGALSAAEKLAEVDNSIESLMLLMDVHLVKGDLVRLEVSARSLLNRTDATSEQLLRAAHLVQLNNPPLARKLWLLAVPNAADTPETTAFAVDLAARLGLESQRGNLMQRMKEYAEQGQGPVKVMNMEQTLEMMKQGMQQQEQLHSMYASAEAPIHLVAKGGLAQVFYCLPEWNRMQPDSQSRKRIFVRHGGRMLPAIDYGDCAQKWRLHCDITSLLLAHELGVLEKIERLFKPLRISRHAMTTLIAQRDKLKPHQKAQLDESHALLEMCSQGKLQVLEEEYEAGAADEVRRRVSEEVPIEVIEPDENAKTVIWADSANLEQQLGSNRLNMLAAALAVESLAVGFLPVQAYSVSHNALLKLPESVSNRIVNCRAIADSLKGNGRISEEAYWSAVKALGTEGKLRAMVTPLIGTRLYLMEGLADVLARAGLLQQTCKNFDVFISGACIRQAESMLQHYERLAKNESWLNELITRLSDGLDEGTYEFICIPDDRGIERDEREEPLNQEFKASFDLFLFEPKESDVLWIDDRALNKYPFRGDIKGRVPIIGINELLLSLHALGELDDHKYYDLLSQLREGDFRYVPLDAREVIHHLKQARIEGGRIVETDALSSLRRYYASSLLDKDFLQLGPNVNGMPSQHSELPFVIQIINATASSIADVWSDKETTLEMAAARADWILSNLYTGTHGCSYLRKDVTPPSNTLTPESVVGVDICNLLMRGIGMLGNPLLPEDVAQRRNHYVDWIAERILNRPYGSSLDIRKSAAEELKERFVFVKSQSRDSDQRVLFTRAFMGRFFLDLPDVVSNEIDFDAELIEWLHLRMGNRITAGGDNFHTHDYWKAVELVLSNGAALITSQDTAAEYHLIRTESEADKSDDEVKFPTVEIVYADGSKVGEMSDPSFGLLLPDLQARRKTLNRLRKWFDLGQKEFEAEADELATIEDSVGRMERFYEWRTLSTELYYSQLEQRFRGQEDVLWSELLPPFPKSLAGRFRLPLRLTDTSFKDLWNDSASALLTEDDLLAVLARFCSLPVALPHVIVATVSDMPIEERFRLFERLASTWTSPPRLLHLANLALRCSSDGRDTEIARKVIARLYDEDHGAADFASFHVVLSFINEEFEELQESTLWSTEIRLALPWLHSCRLHNMLRAVGISNEAILSIFESRRRSAFRDVLVRDDNTWNDCAQPRRLNRTRFLTHAVARILGDIDCALLNAVGVPMLVKQNCFREIDDGSSFPTLALLNDPQLANDTLGSLFAGDRHTVLASMIGAEGIELLSSENLREGVGSCLYNLAEDPSRVSNWAWIQAVTDDLPIYAAFRDVCKSALEEFDPLKAREHGFQVAYSYFRVTSIQVMHLADESLRQKYRRFLIDFFKQEVTEQGDGAESDEDDSLDRRVSVLIEIALMLSRIRNDPEASSREFTHILERMSELWPAFVKNYRNLLSNQVWNMPVDEGDSWWHLMLRIRAMK